VRRRVRVMVDLEVDRGFLDMVGSGVRPVGY